MASLKFSYHFSTTTITLLLIILLLRHLPFPVFSSNHELRSAISPRELLYEEENRLGSTPPSCHNKCNDCHPCMAVQVPSLPSHDSVPPHHHSTKIAAMESWFTTSSQQGNRYSNYKPLGWKCRCGDHFFNP